ncbi:hypothetical protein [Gimesia sp.]|uniref:hypothetical protein n=1 Tax=Gimesia sp. TaxID=2024833 RepID=UPI003A93F5E8
MRLNQLRLFCLLLAAVCCCRGLPAQEKKDASGKTQIHASRIEENVARIYREMPELKPPASRSSLAGRKPGEAHLVPVTLPPILPARFEGAKTTIQLPAEYSDVVEGGGGRFLIFYLKKLKQMAIFDVSAARIVKYLPLDSEDVAFAASANKLLIVARDKAFIRRYDLFTFERELTKPLPEPDLFYRIAMGSASNGPFLLRSGEDQLPKHWFLYDLATLEPNGLQVETERFDVRGGPHLLLRASANGRVFTLRDLHNAASLVVDQNSANKFKNTYSGGYPFPSADGKTIYHNRRVFNSEMKPQSSPFNWLGVPSSSGDFFLTRGDNEKSSTLLIMQPGNPDPVLSVPEIGEPVYGEYYSLFKADETGNRLYFIQDAKTLIFLPASNTEIVLYRFDLERALEESGKDYFLVISQPPVSAERGAKFTYPLQVKAKPAQVKFKVNIGPEGMTVNPQGLVEWQVPRDLIEEQVDVVLSMTKPSGKEILQTFRLAIQGEQTATDSPAESVVTPESAELKTDTKYTALPTITPVPFKGDQKQINLPTPMTDLVTGGGGRYLIMYLKALKRLAVFDCSQGAIVKYLPVDSEDILFAASGYHLMVLLRDKMLIQRWNLSTLKRELTIPAPTTARIGGMVMGSASHGPLVLFCEPGPSILFLDPDTMQLLALEKERESDKNRSVYRGIEPRYLPYAAASANGQVIAVGETILVLKGNSYERRLSPLLFYSSGVRKQKDYGMRPSTDGTQIYAPLNVYNQQMIRDKNNRQSENLLIPATQPGFYLSLVGHYSRGGSTGLALCLEGQSKPFTDLKEVDVSLNRIARDHVFSMSGMAYTKRYTLVPDAHLLIQIPTGDTSLVLHKVNPELLMKQNADHYLFVSSPSLSAAHLGQPWQHQIKVQPKQGGVNYQLSNGPEGMAVSPAGLVTWKPPKDFARLQVVALIFIEDQSGKSISHHLTVSIPEAAENAARAAAEELARIKAVKEARERLEQERRKQEYERQSQRGRMRKIPVQEPQAITTQYAVKVGPIAKAKADANAQRLFEQKAEELNQRQLTRGTRTWTDYKENQFEAQLIRVFAGYGYFNTPIMKQDRTSLPLKLPLDKLSTEDRKYVTAISGYLANQRNLYENLKTEVHSPRPGMTKIVPGLERFTFRGSHTVPPYSVDDKGKPLLSWRVQILPAIGGLDLYRLFHHDEPWDSPHNIQLLPFMPEFYRSPDSNAALGKTNLLGVSGKHSLFSAAAEDQKPEVKDSLNKTALLVEVPDQLAVEWTKPADWEYVDQNSIKSLYGFRDDGFYVLLADGSSRFVSSKNSLDTLSRLFTCDDGLLFELK